MDGYQIYLKIAHVNIKILSQIPLKSLIATSYFISDKQNADFEIEVTFSKKIPELRGKYCGKDEIFEFYKDGPYYYEKSIEGTDGSVSLVIYKNDLKECQLYINEAVFPDTIRSIDKVLQLLPMKQLLTYHHTLMLHSSRISYDHKAIVFTAPSHTGKTTQSKLWSQYEASQIVSNDRSLLRKIDNTYYTFGYPVDGSSPIYSNEEIPLGAIVVLRQDKENIIEKLSVQLALKYLMEQTAYDNWNNEERVTVMQLWLNLLEMCPVYMLKCRPDKDAVQCLKQQLIKDEVIRNGK